MTTFIEPYGEVRGVTLSRRLGKAFVKMSTVKQVQDAIQGINNGKRKGNGEGGIHASIAPIVDTTVNQETAGIISNSPNGVPRRSPGGFTSVNMMEI